MLRWIRSFAFVAIVTLSIEGATASPADQALSLLNPPVEGTDYDIPAIRTAVEEKLLSYEDIFKLVPKGYFPPETEVLDSQLLKYQNARIDVFLSGSKLHQIAQEFVVISVDGQTRALGLVSSGDKRKKKAISTPAKRWELYGVDKNRRSVSANDSPMPYALLLSNFGDKFYSNIAFHGTFSGANGTPRSLGCIRMFTESFIKPGTADKSAVWDNWGLHRIAWNALIPEGITKADHVEGDLFYGSWYSESKEQRDVIREIRYKTTIFTHNAASLKKIEGWREAFEKLYSKEFIEDALVRGKKSGGYVELGAADEGALLDLGVLRLVYELERTIYKTPKYLKVSEVSDEEHYDRRHLKWIKNQLTSIH